MSGGSYNYLYSKDKNEMVGALRNDLPAMARELEEALARVRKSSFDKLEGEGWDLKSYQRLTGNARITEEDEVAIRAVCSHFHETSKALDAISVEYVRDENWQVPQDANFNELLQDIEWAVSGDGSYFDALGEAVKAGRRLLQEKRKRTPPAKGLASAIMEYARAHAIVARHDAWEGEGHHRNEEEKNEYEKAHDDIVMYRYFIAENIGTNPSDLELELP